MAKALGKLIMMIGIRRPGRLVCTFLKLFVAFSLAYAAARCGLAQGGGGGQNQQQNQIAGVEIDAEGVLRIKRFADPTGALMRQRLVEAQQKLQPQLARPSPLRKVSLVRLEAALAARLAAKQGETDEMRYLAGLTRVTHVFFYPETKDIVIAGPAEGFFLDASGRPLGVHSGRAVVELVDLVAALRAFPPSGKPTPSIRVSIDPTQEGLERLTQFLHQVGRNVGPRQVPQLVSQMKEVLGPQRITIAGVSDRTHFAQVLVEADYRMKLISIGLETPPVPIGSYAERAGASVSRNALARFYFTPDYDCVRVSEDGLAMQLEGDGVKLITEQEFITATGQRVESGGSNRAAEAFARAFTEHYGELAGRSPVFGQLRNLIDLSLAAAFIQQQDYYSQSDWYLGVWADEASYPIETYPAPKTVESAVNAIWRGRMLMTPIGGGVNIQPRLALRPERVRQDEQGQLRKQRSDVAPLRLAPGQWWWD